MSTGDQSTSNTYVTSIQTSTLNKDWVVEIPDQNDEYNKKYEDICGTIISTNGIQIAGAIKDVSTHAVDAFYNFSIDLKGNVSPLSQAAATSVGYCGTKAAYTLNMAGVTFVFSGELSDLSGIEESVVSESSNIKYINGVYFFAEQVDAAIYDVQGRCVKAAKAATEIATTGLNKGVYILKAGNEVVKFIK